MTDWADRFAAADATVDEELGDEIELSTDGATYVTVKAFVFPPGAEADIDGYAPIDPIMGKPRVKISRLTLSQPSKANRFRIPQLADPLVTRYRPENWTPVSGGRYWLIDVQKAST